MNGDGRDQVMQRAYSLRGQHVCGDVTSHKRNIRPWVRIQNVITICEQKPFWTLPKEENIHKAMRRMKSFAK